MCNLMVTQPAPQTEAVFGAIADPTRRAILHLLRSGDRSAGDIASRFPVSRPAISRHVRVLREAGLVREQRIRQSRVYSLSPERLTEVASWIDSYRIFWGARLHDLKQLVEREQQRISTSDPIE
ncbi:MAG: metalloregulator ArsR/SmtB family transcription factor [Gemmatimonadaceae bacterium]